MKRALFPGTFDPPTLGHLDLIERAARLCDELHVGIGINSNKSSLFSAEEKKELLEMATKHLRNVKIVAFSGLVVTYAKQQKIDALVRGLRGFSDFEYELQMAFTNRKIGEIETLFLMANEQHAHISATLIRELAQNGKRLHGFVPAEIEERVFTRLSKG